MSRKRSYLLQKSGAIRHLIDQLAGLQDRGIEFRSLQENIDTSSSGGRLIFHIFASLAEFERDLIRERTNAGLKAARARGRVGGRRPLLTKDKLRTARKLYEQQDMTVARIGEVWESAAPLFTGRCGARTGRPRPGDAGGYRPRSHNHKRTRLTHLPRPVPPCGKVRPPAICRIPPPKSL